MTTYDDGSWPMTEHTPKPWEIDWGVVDEYEITAPTPGAPDAGSIIIAHVYYNPANARLIGASPDLLAALKAVEHTNGYCPWCYATAPKHKPDCPRQLAIARATSDD